MASRQLPLPVSPTADKNLLRPLMPELDSLRGLAVLGVVFLHGFYWQYSQLHWTGFARFFMRLTAGGWVGVNLFFVLSGFLITGILLDSRTKPHYYRRFYTRRALRILPAYYGLLLLLAVLGQASASYLGLSFIYLSNLTYLVGVPDDYGPLWSLAVEEQYYLFWPLVVRRLNVKSLAVLAAAICVVIPLLRLLAFSWGAFDGLSRYTWLVADGLAAGAIIACYLRSCPDRSNVIRTCALLMVAPLLAAFAGAPFGILTRTRALGAALQHTIIDAFFAGMLLLFLLLGTSKRRSWVNLSFLKFLGYLSYGLYLLHLLIFRLYDRVCTRFWPHFVPGDDHFALVVWRFMIVLSSALILAYLSRRYFEENFLRLKDNLSPSAVAPASPNEP